MTIRDAADITGDNAVHAISSVAGSQARRLWLTASGGSVRFGSTATVGSSRGVLLPVNVEYAFSASDADPTDTIDLTVVGCYVPSGATLTIAWGV